MTTTDTSSDATAREVRRARGKALRDLTRRECHADWKPARDRPDPITLLEAQDESRIRELVPIKYGRMVESAFAFYRGSAVLMASDLQDTPKSGLNAFLCGDAHLSNFGLFASPERRLVFDINDFDEAFPGPWEWDLKRLATSAVIAGRDNDFGAKKCRSLAVTTVRSYRDAMRRFSELSTLDVWYFHVKASTLLDFFEGTSKKSEKSAEQMIEKAKTKTHGQTLEKMTHKENGRRKINNEPPLLVPQNEAELGAIVGAENLSVFNEAAVYGNWREYVDSLPEDRQFLLRRYRPIDSALRVGGVGSVGTRCWVMLLQGEGYDDALLLQVKEAGASVLEPYLPEIKYTSQGQRVVVGQQLMQAVSDIFLGWNTSDATGIDYYWRQLKDLKGSADIASLDETGLETYMKVCATCLARAHARTGDEAAIVGYIGKGDLLAEAIGDFSVTYADQAESDYQALVAVVKNGRLKAETGV